MAQKIILHIDFNSFFASVEQQANPFLRGKPLAVAGKGKHSIDVSGAHSRRGRFDLRDANLQRTVITTASREAKRLGVKTAMASTEALRICPELYVVPGDPKKYGEITQRFLSILRRHTPFVEQFSTDEAFADLTHVAVDWMGALLIAQIIRAEIKEEIGTYCSASMGIASNKLLAKLACESVKPSGLTLVRPEQAEAFVRTCALQDICGIGPRIERKLNSLGITTTAGLQETPLPQLINHFHSYGEFLFSAARGLGDHHVEASEAPPKSIGHSYTFPKDLHTEQDIKRHLLALCDKVAIRCRRQGLLPTHLSVYARYADFGGNGMQKQFKESMYDGLQLYRNAWNLLQYLRDPEQGIRLLGISASGLLHAHAPESLFQKDRKVHKVLQALDDLQTRYGSGVWQRAATLPTHFKERVSGWHYDHEL